MTRLLVGLATITLLMGQVALPPYSAPIATITQEDAQALNEVLQTTIPPRYSAGVVKWFTDLVDRHKRSLPEPEK